MAEDPAASTADSTPSRTRTRQPECRVGCSGWNYASWRGTFYPKGMPPAQWLEHYTSIFDTVEINNTFYRLPEEATFASWRARTPPGFLIAVKASRFLTHIKRLRDPGEPTDRLFSRAMALGPRLGPVLYQLPGNFKIDLPRLEAFLAQLPRRPRRGTTPPLTHVMEFRHPSWYVDETYALLTRMRVALCLHDKAGSELDTAAVGGALYVRFHGTSGHYRGSYELPATRTSTTIPTPWRPRTRGRCVGCWAPRASPSEGAVPGLEKTVISRPDPA